MRTKLFIAITATIPVFFTALQGCKTTPDDVVLSDKEMEDFSELANIGSVPQKSAPIKKAASAESILYRMNPVGSTTGQASGLIYGTCLSNYGVEFISKQLDFAVMKTPEVLGQSRIGFDSEKFVSNKVSFFVFDSIAEAKGAQKVVFRRQRGAAVKDPAIYLSCDEANSFKAPIVQRYVELYLAGTRYESLASGIGAYVELFARSSSEEAAKKELAVWHKNARRIVKAHPKLVKNIDRRDPAMMNMSDEMLARSFAAYVVERYGLRSSVDTSLYSGSHDGYSKKLGRGFAALRTDWLKEISKDKFAQLSQR